MNQLMYDYPLLGKELSKDLRSDFFLLNTDTQSALISRYLRDELGMVHDYDVEDIKRFIEDFEFSYNKLDQPDREALLKEFENKSKAYKAAHPILSRIFKNDNDLKTQCAVAYEQKVNEYILSNEMDSKLKSSAGSSIKNAAALCVWTYAFDPNRTNEYGEITDNVYHTDTQGWFPLITEEIQKNLNKRIKIDAPYILKGDCLLSCDKELSLMDKIGFGTFKGIFGDVELFAELEKRLVRKRTGFFSMIYYRKTGNSYEFAYVTSGTTFRHNNINQKYDLVADNVLANGVQAITGMSPQYTLAIQNAKILSRLCKLKNYKLYFYGHSLGGGMAIANALATEREAIVFNNAGLNRVRNLMHPSSWVLLKNTRKKVNTNIKRVFTNKDFLSTEKQNKNQLLKPLHQIWFSPQDIGQKIYYGTGGHSIDGMCKGMGLLPMKHAIEESGI